MHHRTKLMLSVSSLAGLCLAGCSASRVDLGSIERPARAPELAAFDVFVGSWDWEAETVYPEDANTTWKGTAEWQWTLDDRCLHGTVSAKSDDAEFEAAGIWSWHPKSKKYIWWMFNNWGYPQEGTAVQCKESKWNRCKCKECWCMPYKSVGLDGSTSYGRYCMEVVDKDTLAWKMTEWALPFHLIKKIQMEGTYTRRK